MPSINAALCLLWFPVAALLAGCDRAPVSDQVHAAQLTENSNAVAALQPMPHDPPLVLDVCGKPQTYTQVPQRAVTHDVNITEMFLFLGLGDRLVGYSGIPSRKEIAPEIKPVLDLLPNLSSHDMSLEAMVDARTDFVFAGWSYGFRAGGVTPELLAEHGIASYVLAESCIRVNARQRVGLEDVELDLGNLARIFDVEGQAIPRISQLKTARERLAGQMAANASKPRVFVFDSGEKIPVTAGRYGMPQAILDAAGARNIFDDIPSNWPRGNWEDVIERDPQWIVIVDYGMPSAQGKMGFLLAKPELAQVSAIRKRQFFVMSYAQATPGPRSVQVTQRLAATLHPELEITTDALTWPTLKQSQAQP